MYFLWEKYLEDKADEIVIRKGKRWSFLPKIT
jgi:hypothetical protein